MWRTEGEVSILDPDVIRDICLAEQNTQRVLQSEGLCGGCPTSCLPPLSIVSFARIHVQDFSLRLSCAELGSSWEVVRSRLELNLMACAKALRSNYTIGGELPRECPLGFAPHILDSSFGVDDNLLLRTSSSVFATGYNGNASDDALYELSESYDRAETSTVVRGVYDTNREDFNLFAFSRAIWSDTALAFFAGVVTTLAMVVHTKSLWLTFAGLIQILVSFPLSYFFYRFAFRIEFFPFLNFLGIYVVLALGADDVSSPCTYRCSRLKIFLFVQVFVAVDKWKNARIAYPMASREEIASLALPDAATAMCLTTVSIFFL